MTQSTLHRALEKIEASWTGLNTATVLAVKQALEGLAQADRTEPWLASIHDDLPARRELYHSRAHGFILLAHVEQGERYRPPHDHGAGWIFYAVQHGATEISTYGRITNPAGETHLVSRGARTVGPGQCEAYLPGDIHDTRALSEYLVLFRLSSWDFAKEREEGRTIIYPVPDGAE